VKSAVESKSPLLEPRVEVVEVWAPDIHATPRGKRFPAALFATGPASGFNLADSVLCWTRNCELYDDVAFSNTTTGYPDLLVLPDLETMRQLPWAPERAVVLGRLVALDGDPLEVDPRQVLIRQLDAAARAGYDVLTSIEYEFSLLDANDQPVRVANECYAFGVAGIDDVLERLTIDLPKCGLPIEAAETEWGMGQLEVTMEPQPALRAADQAFLFKALVKDFARSRGLTATFMPKPFADQAGNGLHVNQSLWKDGHNVFDCTAAGFAGPAYLAGLIERSSQLFLLGAPTINAYKRRAPGSFAPTTSTWSEHSRTVAIRGMFGRGPEASRVEFRIPGADANPYLVVAGCIASGLDGVRRQLEPPPAQVGDAYAIAEPSLSLPSSLEAALAAFAVPDDVDLGYTFREHYASVVRHEALSYAAAITDWERARYLSHA
jgi:glutamine synthetase